MLRNFGLFARLIFDCAPLRQLAANGSIGDTSPALCLNKRSECYKPWL